MEGWGVGIGGPPRWVVLHNRHGGLGKGKGQGGKRKGGGSRGTSTPLLRALLLRVCEKRKGSGMEGWGVGVRGAAGNVPAPRQCAHQGGTCTVP